jgi:hypothetical protein
MVKHLFVPKVSPYNLKSFLIIDLSMESFSKGARICFPHHKTFYFRKLKLWFLVVTVLRIVTIWYGSGSSDPFLWLTDPDPALFVSNLQDANKKLFCLLLFKGTFASFFTNKRSLRSHKTVEIKVFLTIFAWWWDNPDPHIWLTDPDPGGPKTCGSGTLLCTYIYMV